MSFNVTSHELGTVQENSTTSQIRLYTVRQKTRQNYFVISSRLLHKLTNFCKISYQLLPPTKEEVHVFARVCLSVCLLARLLKNACMDLDEMSTDVGTWTN